jgi:hypothetical protein
VGTKFATTLKCCPDQPCPCGVAASGAPCCGCKNSGTRCRCEPPVSTCGPA